MKTHLVLALLVMCIFSSIASAQTAEEIIERNIAARGGTEKFRAIRSMSVTTVEEASWGGRGSTILRIIRPDRMRFDYTWQADPKAIVIMIITAFDGKTGWWADQHKGLRAANVVTGEQLEGLREDAQKQLADSFSELQANGNTIEFVGKDTVDGRSCYKIRFTTRAGIVRYAYYDTESFLEVRNEQVVSLKNKKEKLLPVAIGDYRSVNGILFPHTFKIDSVLTCAFASAEWLPLPMVFFENKKLSTTSTIQSIEINSDMDESWFKVPATNGPDPTKR